MKRISIRPPLFFVVAFLMLTMVIGPWGQFVTPAYAEGEGDFGKICFDGDADYEWAYFYNVDSVNDSLSLDDLNITVLNGAGQTLNPTKYDLSIQGNLSWNEALNEPEGEEVAEPFGIGEDGFGEYLAIATATDGSGNQCKARFVIAHKYSLNDICAEIGLEGFAEQDGWRMHDRYWYLTGDPISLWVKHNGAENNLNLGQDYDVAYYRLSNPEEMEDPSKDFDYFLVADEETVVTENGGVPNEPGTYFARIEGIDPYYGGNEVIIDIVDEAPIIKKEIRIESDDWELWSDDELVFDVIRPEGIEGDYRFIVGTRGEDDWEKPLDDPKYFEFDDTDNKLILHGAEIYKELGECHLDIYANIKNQADAVIAEGFADAEVKEAKYEYNLPEDDNLLPGWDGRIDNSTISLHIENREHPGGHDEDVPVTNVTLKDVDPAGAVTLEEKDNGWNYKAEGFGSATICLEYTDMNGAPKEHEFEVRVSNTVYHVDMRSVTGVRQGLPGTSLKLQADAIKHTAIQKRDHWEHNDTSEGLKYQWAISEGDRLVQDGEFATIKQDKKDPSKATLTFKDKPAEWDSIDECVNVVVTVTDDNSGNAGTVRTERWEDFWVSDDYIQIEPATNDPNLEVGKSETIEPKLKHYRLGEESSVIDAQFSMDDVDDKALDVNDETEGEFTITRKGDWDTNFRITANFEWEDGRPDEIDQWYRLNNRNYWIGFEQGDYDIYDDEVLTVNLNKEDLDNLMDDIKDPDNKDYQIKYTVGRWNDDINNWDMTLSEDKYEATTDGITISGATIRDEGLDGVNIRAELTIAGDSWGDEDSWCNLNLYEACEDKDGDGEGDHHWVKATVKEPTLDKEGLEIWICVSHPLLDWEGCGRIRFVTTPKKININGASISVNNVTYNKKAQTPAPTVKFGNETLKAGTDYTVAFSNNTNAGTAKVTITGKGKYAGTKEATFNIAKAANPMALKAKKPTVKLAAVKKKNQTVKQAAACTVSGAQGKVTWKKASGNAKITVAANGKITVKKGIKKGNYKVKLNATAAGNANYNKATKAVTVTIVVK